MRAKKSLGQHWLFDKTALDWVVVSGEIKSQDTVLEIGPGLGTLTERLQPIAKEVIAVELDRDLFIDLEDRLKFDNLKLVNQDILKFNLDTLPCHYKVVANIPYNLTSKILRVFNTSSNPPDLMSLLVQKEVAQRIAAKPGKMSILAVSVQLYNQVALKEIIPANLFKPVPKVDSQIIQLIRHPIPIFEIDEKKFMHLVKAGFANKRKTLLNSLSGGLKIDKQELNGILKKLELPAGTRAQILSLTQWYQLYNLLYQKGQDDKRLR